MYLHLAKLYMWIYNSICRPTQQTQNIGVAFIQCWADVEDVWPMLYECYTGKMFWVYLINCETIGSRSMT